MSIKLFDLADWEYNEFFRVLKTTDTVDSEFLELPKKIANWSEKSEVTEIRENYETLTE